ncbi:MAG: hypothetical protein R2715_22900 [Ilumatobacteraceae bacterium]
MTAPAQVSSAVRLVVDRLDARWSRLIGRIDQVNVATTGWASPSACSKVQDDRLPSSLR